MTQKISIIGTSGCGKSTLARRISRVTGQKVVDLDDLYWLPDWKPRPDEEFFTLIERETSANEWIITGNYSRSHHLLWCKADMIIWLDLPLTTCLWRGLKRSLHRCLTRKPCCNGNHETLGRLLSRKSILHWILTTYGRRKRHYSKLFEQGEGPTRLVQLKNTREVKRFLEGLC